MVDRYFRNVLWLKGFQQWSSGGKEKRWLISYRIVSPLVSRSGFQEVKGETVGCPGSLLDGVWFVLPGCSRMTSIDRPGSK